MGSARAALGGVFSEPGRQAGVQHGSAAHTGIHEAHGGGSRAYSDHIQFGVRAARAHFRILGRQVQQKGDDSFEHRHMEFRDNAHGAQHGGFDVHRIPQLRHGARRGDVRARQLLNDSRLPQVHARRRDEHSPDLLLFRRHSQRIFGGLHRAEMGVAERLSDFRSCRRAPRARDVLAAARQKPPRRRNSRSAGSGKFPRARKDKICGGHARVVQGTDRRHSHGLFRGADIRADRIPHLDADVPVRKIFDEPRRRGLQLHVLHPPRGVRGDSHRGENVGQAGG